MVQLYANNARSSLASGITTLSTTMTVATGQGVKFPSPTGSDYFMVTIVSGSIVEVVKCTSRTVDVLTVARGQEGTTPASWSTGATVEMRITRDTLTNHETVVEYIRKGQIPFPITQNPSADPNVLDDYEEGTWTPILAGNIGHSPGGYFVQKGRYTKIGNVVRFAIELQINGYGTLVNSEAIFITGLPFTPGSGATYPGWFGFPLTTTAATGWAIAPAAPHSSLNAGDPTIYLKKTVSEGDLLKDDVNSNTILFTNGSFWV